MNIVEFLIDSKLCVHAPDATIDHLRYRDVFMHGQNVVLLVTEYSQECLEHLIFGQFDEIAANIEDKDYFENTPLHLAASNVTPHCASKILDCVENVKTVLSLKDAKGNSPLHVVCQKGNLFCKFLHNIEL